MKQPEALRLVDELVIDYFGETLAYKAAAELRRLHEANQAMLEALKLGVGETLDYISRNHLTGAENNQWIVQARAAIAKGEQQ